MSNFHGVNYKINSKGPMNDLSQSRYLNQDYGLFLSLGGNKEN